MEKFLKGLTMSKSFKGRSILPGKIEGEALVTRSGFNAYASFYNSLHHDAVSAVCADSGNKALFGKDLTGKIVCLPKTIGSTSAGAVWQRVASLGVAPIGMLFSESIDSLAAAGLIVADLWVNKRIVTIDRLGQSFLGTVQNGSRIEIKEDGVVEVD